jgi:antitoxin ParD1/3/4
MGCDGVREWSEERDPLGHTVEDLRILVKEGLESGPSPHATMTEVKTEARRRHEAGDIASAPASRAP